MKLRNQSCQLILGHYTANTRTLHTDTSFRKFPSLGRKFPSLGKKIRCVRKKNSKRLEQTEMGMDEKRS